VIGPVRTAFFFGLYTLHPLVCVWSVCSSRYHWGVLSLPCPPSSSRRVLKCRSFVLVCGSFCQGSSAATDVFLRFGDNSLFFQKRFSFSLLKIRHLLGIVDSGASDSGFKPLLYLRAPTEKKMSGSVVNLTRAVRLGPPLAPPFFFPLPTSQFCDPC